MLYTMSKSCFGFYIFQSGNLEKLNKLVKFPEVLNLAPYMSGTSDKYPIYHLYAVVVHLNTMNAAYSGHYISYVKNFRGEWFRIDDSRVCYLTTLFVILTAISSFELLNWSGGLN